MSEITLTGVSEATPVGRMMLADPTGQIERECADGGFTQKSVALTWGCSRCAAMHRRAQAAESAAAKAIRQNDHAQLWKTVDYLRRYVATREARCTMWIGRYRELKRRSTPAPPPDEKPGT